LPALRYVARFHSGSLAVVARGAAFVAGSFLGVLVLHSLASDDAFLFYVHTADHNLLWHLGVLSAVFAVARSLAAEPPDEVRQVEGDIVHLPTQHP
jgi:hypothetical protein